MTIKPVLRATALNRQQFVGITKAKARLFARAELEVMGREWEVEVVNIVQDEFEHREGDRHKENTTHLDASFTHLVTEGGDHGFPMLLDLTTKSGVNAAKVAALNYGVDHDYEIVPSGTTAGIGGRSKKLTNAQRAKIVSTGISVQDTQWLRWEDSAGNETFARSVIHRAFTGSRFMERARDIVLARHRRRG